MSILHYTKQKFHDALLSKGITIKKIDYENYFVKSLLPRLKESTYVNLGAGKFNLNGWTVMDYSTPSYNYSSEDRFIQYDISSQDPIPFSDDSVDGLYCSHVFEHFGNEVNLHLLNEIERVLKKGSIARIVVPDAVAAYDAMKRNDKDFFVWNWWNSNKKNYSSYTDVSPIDWPIEFQWLSILASERVPLDKKLQSDHKISLELLKDMVQNLRKEELMDQLVEPLSYQYNQSNSHINWFSLDKFERLLEEASTTLTVYKSEYLKSSDPQMRVEGYFDNTWPQMSLYVEFKKVEL
jgi:SAM-dependent methyltransferase